MILMPKTPSCGILLTGNSRRYVGPDNSLIYRPDPLRGDSVHLIHIELTGLTRLAVNNTKSR